MSTTKTTRVTVLFIFAHPDDECLMAGLIARLRRQGYRVVIYYATRGEAGQTSGLCQPKDLAVVRSQELSEATRILGVSRVVSRNFGDGELPSKEGILVADIQKVLEEERPNRVITFPPSGITGHPDHQMIQRATLAAVRAWVQASSAETKLYYRIIPSNITGIVGVVYNELPVTHRFNVAPYWDRMYEALLAHRTQKDAMSTIFPALRKGGGGKKLWPEECYTAITLV